MLRPAFCDPLLESDMTTGAVSPPPYRGRFAPTPSGPLHLGSLLTALASWLQARAQRGHWLLRIDDLDIDRCQHGAADEILRQLQTHELHWDAAPRYQSRHRDEYAAALTRLQARGRVYACACTRAQIKRESRPGPDGPVYSGRCRHRQLPVRGHALRLDAGTGNVALDDLWQGRQTRSVDTEIGDFVIWRRDEVPGYQLACAVDEAAMDITEIVRGSDLLGSTFMQLRVMALLDQAQPRYGHLPVLAQADGRKLSKQNRAAPLVAASAGINLWRCLGWLGQNPPAALRSAPPRLLLEWGLTHWHPERVPRATCIKVEQAA